MKTPITLVLILSLLAAPYRICAEEKAPSSGNDKDLMAMACVVIVVGAVVVYGLWKLCKKIPVLNPPPPPNTNAPPPLHTNTAHLGKSSWVLPRIQMPDRDLFITDDWQVAVAAFQSSTDSVHWVDCLYVTNWIGASNIVCVAADSSGPLATNCLTWTPNTETICDFGNLAALLPEGQKRFYRTLELP